MIKRILRLGLGICVLLALVVVILTWTSAPELPPGVVKKSASVNCGNKKVAVDFYYNTRFDSQPMVVVAHGFSRSRHYMAVLGAELAGDGMIVAVLTQPFWGDHSGNAAVVAALARLGRENGWPVDATGNGRMGLVGFSMGGLTSLLAAASLTPPVDAWVGLDPVDSGGLGAAGAGRVNAPGLALLAAKHLFNMRGSTLEMLRNYAGSIQILTVKNSTHCDAESPTDLLGQLAFGRVNPGAQEDFRSTTRKFLREVFAGNYASPLPGHLESLAGPGNERRNGK